MADLFIVGVAPIDYSPILLLKPFGFRIAPDTLSSGIRRATGSRSVLAVSGFRLRARLDFSIPSCSPGQRGITPAFGYSAPHPSAEGTSTPMIHALPSAPYHSLCLRPAARRASSNRRYQRQSFHVGGDRTPVPHGSALHSIDMHVVWSRPVSRTPSDKQWSKGRTIARARPCARQLITKRTGA